MKKNFILAVTLTLTVMIIPMSVEAKTEHTCFMSKCGAPRAAGSIYCASHKTGASSSSSSGKSSGNSRTNSSSNSSSSNKSTTSKSTNKKNSKKKSYSNSYDDGYESLYLYGDYDDDRYRSDWDYQLGVDDAMDEWGW